MNADKRVYRTEDGRLVGEGHPEGAFLAYAVGDEVSPDDARKLAPKAPEKKAPPTAKAHTPTRNK